MGLDLENPTRNPESSLPQQQHQLSSDWLKTGTARRHGYDVNIGIGQRALRTSCASFEASRRQIKRKMIPPNASLVRYDNPVLVNRNNDKKQRVNTRGIVT